MFSSELVAEQKLCKLQLLLSCLREDVSVLRLLLKVSFWTCLGYFKNFELPSKSLLLQNKTMRGHAMVDLTVINK